LLSAIEFVRQRYPDAKVWLAGFSFGAAMMLRAAACDDRVLALVAVGVPVTKYDFSTIAKCNKPKLVVQGSEDEFGPGQGLEEFFTTLDQPKKLKIIDGADHFFDGRLNELGEAVSEFIVSVDSSQP
jgi:alpha/beta superfamily hydrolase